MKFEVLTNVSDKGISKSKRDELNNIIMSLTGKRIKITIERAFNKRSNNQNAYLHGVVIPLIKHRLIELGFAEAKSDDWVKDFIKYNCLLKEFINQQTGEIIKSLGRTSGLSKSEFMDFIAEVQMWAAEKLDVYIPDPNEEYV